MISTPSPIRSKKLSQIVEERLLELIREQQMQPGDFMPSERELMEMYQIGRPAIREAMQNLQRMGLVEIRHGERPKIAEPTLNTLLEQMAISMQHLLTHSSSSLEHLKQARATMEAEMARIAARERRAKDIKKLNELLVEQEKSKSDPLRFLELDGAFHKQIAAISGNPIFEAVNSAVFEWLRVFHAEQVRKPGLEDLTIDEHRLILSAIEKGDVDAASKAMQEHLTRANKLYHKSNFRA